MARVLLAPDKFKGTLTGAEVAASLAEGIRSRRPTADVVAFPVAVDGPQKGADPDQVNQLDAALAHWADVVVGATGHDHRANPGPGAVGGFAMVAILGATLRRGAQLMLGQLGPADALADADLIVTGEGSRDEQTLRGKAPAAVAAAARAAGVPIVAVSGRCPLDAARLEANGFDGVETLLDEAATPRRAFDDVAGLSRRIGARLADRLPHD